MFGRQMGMKGESQPLELHEVSFAASHDVLRRLARFFDHCATQLEARKLADHAHFSDFDTANRKMSVEVVVVNPDAYGKRG